MPTSTSHSPESPENGYFPFVQEIETSQDEALPPMGEESSIVHSEISETQPEAQNTPKASEMFISYFMLGATGIKLPVTDEEKESFLTGFITSEVLTGGKAISQPGTTGGAEQFSQAVRIAGPEMSKAEAYFDSWRKTEVEKGKINVDNVGKELETNDEISHKLAREIEELLREHILDEHSRYETKNQFIKQIATESIKTIAEKDPASIDKIEELFKRGEDSAAIALTIELFNKPENQEIIEATKEKICEDWANQQITGSK